MLGGVNDRPLQPTRPPYTPETLLPAYQTLLTALRHQLPPAMAATLQGRRTVERHGTCSTVFLWTLWHAGQHRDVLPPVYTAWSVNYDPNHFETRHTDWMLKFQCNTVRIYSDRLEPRAYLLERLPAVVPTGFDWHPHPRFLAIERGFDFDGAPASLPPLLLPWLASLVRAVHPVLDDFIERLGPPMPKQRRREFIASRNKPRARAGYGQGAAYRHGISSALAEQVLALHGWRCALCGQPIQQENDLTFDHKIPFSKGGLTVLSNLQPAHRSCNTRKRNGNL